MKSFCGYCGFYGELIFVHSHYECPRCHNNILPCCEGENTIEEQEEKEETKDKKLEVSENKK